MWHHASHKVIAPMIAQPLHNFHCLHDDLMPYMTQWSLIGFLVIYSCSFERLLEFSSKAQSRITSVIYDLCMSVFASCLSNGTLSLTSHVAMRLQKSRATFKLLSITVSMKDFSMEWYDFSTIHHFLTESDWCVPITIPRLYLCEKYSPLESGIVTASEKKVFQHICLW